MDVRSLCSGAAVSACAGSHGGLAMDRVATLSACGGSMGGGSWLETPSEDSAPEGFVLAYGPPAARLRPPQS